MTKIIYIKTTRTSCGYAKAEISRFVNYSVMKYHYSFKFYNTHKFFDTYKELKDYVDLNYELINLFDYSAYTLPENRKECFR